jgi:hypothetical protein
MWPHPWLLGGAVEGTTHITGQRDATGPLVFGT